MGSLLVIVILVAGIAVVAGIAYYNRNNKSLDLNQDGKIDIEDAVTAVKRAVAESKIDVKQVLDVNKDGKLDLADVTVIANAAKKTVNTVKAAVEAPAKKAVAKKAVAKTASKAKKAADVNKDGKVNAKDAKAAVAKSVAKAEIAAKRARKGGRFVADDPSTPDVNEAYKSGKAPKKK